MDSNNLTPLRKGVVGVQFLFVAFGATVSGARPFHRFVYSRYWYTYLSCGHAGESPHLFGK